MMPCPACGTPHNPMLDCGRAKRMAEAANPQESLKPPKTGLRTGSRSDDQDVGDTGVKVVHAGSSRHGKYADVSARRTYRRDWQVFHRALKSGRAERYPRA